MEANQETTSNKSDLNGYTIEIDGKEENQAYFIANLNSKFTIIQGTPDGCLAPVPSDLLLLNTGFNMLLEGGSNIIINE